MAQNKVVVRYQDGRVLKGHTADFLPTKDYFHLESLDGSAGGRALLISVHELKAVFFVKDFAGNPKYDEKKEFDAGKPVSGRKVKVVFKDGEIMVGTTQGYQPGRPGFFMVPADPGSNIDRCFVVAAFTSNVSFM